MKKYPPIIARVLFGLMFLAAGIAGFATNFASPPDLPANMQTFNQGLMASGYFMPFVKGVEAICGLLLLLNMWVPLALVVLAPVVLNIALVNAFMMPEGLPVVAVIGALHIYLAFFVSPYKQKVLPLFCRNLDPFFV